MHALSENLENNVSKFMQLIAPLTPLTHLYEAKLSYALRSEINFNRSSPNLISVTFSPRCPCSVIWIESIIGRKMPKRVIPRFSRTMTISCLWQNSPTKRSYPYYASVNALLFPSFPFVNIRASIVMTVSKSGFDFLFQIQMKKKCVTTARQ